MKKDIHKVKLEVLLETEIDFSSTPLSKEKFKKLSFRDKVDFIKEHQQYDLKFLEYTDIEVYRKWEFTQMSS